MRRAPLRLTAAAVLAAASLSAGAGAAEAKGGNDREVRTSGRCTAGTTWKLKTKTDDGRLEVEVEIDSNRAGQTWTVALADSGTRVFRGTRTTAGRSGSFEVERHIANRAGRDRITTTARNPHSGERCAGSLVF